MCLFFLGHLCLSFLGHWCLFASFETTARAKTLFGQPWAVGPGLLLSGLRPGCAPVFFHSGFGLGLLLFRLPSGFTPFRVSGSVCSFEGSGLLILMFRSGYTLFSLLLCSSVLLFGFRSRFTPFRASACVYSCLGFRAPFIPSPNWDVVF